MLTSTSNKSLPSKITSGLFSSWGKASTSKQKSPNQSLQIPQQTPSHQKQLNEIIAVVDKLSKLADELSTTNIAPIPSSTQTTTVKSTLSVNYDITKFDTATQSSSKQGSNSARSRTDTINPQVFF